MASAFPPTSASLQYRDGPAKSPSLNPTNAPQGTFLPNTKVQVGSQRVTIEKYLSSGGFAHVYVVRVPQANHKHSLAVLKRVAVPDRDHLTSMRTEVETMKKLQGHKHVVTYMDSHASQLKGGGYEVFLLMEYCAGGGLIDFMNTRLQHRLTEPEILKIFGDVAEGVAAMHYLKPPLLHRDLKVENVLISKSMSTGQPVYKICDFGSSAPPRPAAKTAEEGRLIEEDVQKHTTMQYRSPEMIDVWRKQSIDEKADIWALGVLLYKLCYYTTPFENVGQMAILNASFKYPSHPSFSDRLKRLIGSMLKERPVDRPNIYQVIKEVCSMQGTEVPIKDIYANRTQSEVRRNESLPSPETGSAVGLQKQAAQVTVQSIPDIAPMRRGRPGAPSQQTPVAAAAAAKASSAAKPSPSPARGDPFAALDSRNYDVRAGAVDELSKRFPSLDEFSIVHEKGGKFDFPSDAPAAQAQPDAKKTDLNERVTNALADEVFNSVAPAQPPKKPAAAVVVDVPKTQTSISMKEIPASKSSPTKPPTSVQAKVRELSSQQAPVVAQTTPVKPMSYTSTAVGASPPPSATVNNFPDINSRPIWRVPSQEHKHKRSSSQPRASEVAKKAAASLQPSLPPTQRPALHEIHRSKSQTATLTAGGLGDQATSEGQRPSRFAFEEQPLARTKSAGQRATRTSDAIRPSSVYVSSNLDYLRDQETTRKSRNSLEAPWSRHHSRQASADRRHDSDGKEKDEMIEDDMDYLRNTEEGERKMNHFSVHGSLHGHGSHGSHSHHGSQHGHKKKGSMASISNAGAAAGQAAKSVFSGRFGDAFKRFEQNKSDDDDPKLISPVNGSDKRPVATDLLDEDAIDETEDLPPDMRRELERRKLSQEEKRVEAAAAEYRARLAAEGTGAPPPTKASTIQKRVQSLLDEAGQEGEDRRTAEGYGGFTDSPRPMGQRDASPAEAAPPPLARKPDGAGMAYPKTRQQASDPPLPRVPVQPASAPPIQTAPPIAATSQAQPRIVSRPSVPPKSQALRTGGSNKPQWPPQEPQQASTLPTKRPNAPGGGLAALLAKDLEGVPDYPPPGSSANVDSSPQIPRAATAAAAGTGQSVVEDLEKDFSKRYPSLSGIEMVETEIGSGQGRDWKEV
jgi:AP2-associated kinase